MGVEENKQIVTDIYIKYGSMVSRFIRSQMCAPTKERVEDCMHDVFIILCNKIDVVKDYDNIPAWLLEVSARHVRSLNAKFFKRDMRCIYMDDGDQFDDMVGADDVCPNDYCAFTPELLPAEDVRNILFSHISEKDRKLYELKYLQNMTMQQLSEHLGLSEGAVRTRSSRLTERLKQIACKSFGAPEFLKKDT